MKIIYLTLLLFIFSCSDRHRKNEMTISQKYFTIKKFVDGDTFWINDGTAKGIKIRLIGVDTPESQARFGNPEEYYGDEASYFTKKILLNKRVRLEYDKDRTDSFGRTLAYIYLEDGTFLNEKLVKEGCAQVMTGKPNVKYSRKFLKLEEIARTSNIGMWQN